MSDYTDKSLDDSWIELDVQDKFWILEALQFLMDHTERYNDPVEAYGKIQDLIEKFRFKNKSNLEKLK